MLSKKVYWFVALVFTCSILAACGGGTAEPSQEEGDGDLPPVAVIRAREALAADLQVGIETVAIQSWSPQEWSDSCLGLGGPAESCLAAVHPGWQVMLQVTGDELYEVRTDELGDIIRINK
jgi:hypothetical protein